MKNSSTPKKRGFTLMETVIAIGVLAMLLTAFMAVFGPAARGIRKSINVQEADRMASALELELSTLRTNERSGSMSSAFQKAYDWIEKSHSDDKNNLILCYQYRGNPSEIRADGTMEPYTAKEGIPGEDYIVQPIVRRLSNQFIAEDMKARQGRIFFIKLTQLVPENGGLRKGDPGIIESPKQSDTVSVSLSGDGAASYSSAVLPYVAEFYEINTTDWNFISGPAFKPQEATNPMFSRNQAVRR